MFSLCTLAYVLISEIISHTQGHLSYRAHTNKYRMLVCELSWTGSRKSGAHKYRKANVRIESSGWKHQPTMGCFKLVSLLGLCVEILNKQGTHHSPFTSIWIMIIIIIMMILKSIYGVHRFLKPSFSIPNVA